jgi:hypothetical protein
MVAGRLDRKVPKNSRFVQMFQARWRAHALEPIDRQKDP